MLFRSYLGEPDEEFSVARKMASEEIQKEGEKNFGVVAKGMFAKMKRFEAMISKMSESQKAYMAEFEALKEFKKNIEGQKFSYEVESTLRDVLDIMPDEIEKFREESKQFSLDNLESWKNSVKAKAFTFSSNKKDKKVEEIPQKWAYDLKVDSQTKDSLWKIS